MTYGTASSEKPSANESVVVPPVAQPGHIQAPNAITMNSTPHGFQSRVKPVTAVSPVARV